MSFGASIGDVLLLTQLAWKTVQSCRRACGEYDALTLEATSLHSLLQRLESELQNPDGYINRDIDDVQKEVSNIIQGCEKNLRILDLVLEKYNALSETERSGRKLWQRIKFGNGQVAYMTDIRGRNTFYVSAISLFLNMLNLGSVGRVEREMAQAGGELRDIRLAVNGITAYLMTGGPEGSVLTAYANDEKAIWKEFRRELVADGFTSSTIRKHKEIIMAYVKELRSRGLLDETDHNESGGRDVETSRAVSTKGSVEPQADKRSPNEPTSSLHDIISVEDTNPEERSTRIEVEPNPASAVATSDSLEPTPSLRTGPISKDSTPNNIGRVPPARVTTSPTVWAKLRAIELELHSSLIPRCEAIIRSPPADRKEWSMAKPKELVEEILQHVIFELDAMDIEGDAELRALRKDLVWQAQVWLVEVDTISEPSSSDESHHFGFPDDTFQHESDIWPPSVGRSANGQGLGQDATSPQPRGPIVYDNEDESEVIEPGIAGKHAAWLTFAERYICESKQTEGFFLGFGGDEVRRETTRNR